MNEIIVLSGNHRETAAFAKQVGRRARHVTNARFLHGLRGEEIHVLPGFHARPDRHAINAELRYRRGVQRIHYALVEGGLFVTAGELAVREALGPDMVKAIAGDLQPALEAGTAPAKAAPKPRAKKAPSKAEPLVDKPGETPAGRGNLFDFLDGKVD